jgi:hypothetical protein
MALAIADAGMPSAHAVAEKSDDLLMNASTHRAKNQTI